MSDIPPALVDQMVALIRDLRADHIEHCMFDRSQDFVARTAAIVDALPEPIDPDLIEAREMAEARGWFSANHLANLRLGKADDTDAVQSLLLAIKRGRELAKVQS